MLSCVIMDARLMLKRIFPGSRGMLDRSETNL